MKLLLVEDDETQRDILEFRLRREGFLVTIAADGASTESALADSSFDVLILDLQLPDRSGSEVLRRAKLSAGDAAIIVHTGRATLQTAREAVNLDAFAYIEKSEDPAAIISASHRAARRTFQRRLAASEDRLRELIRQLPDLIIELDGDGRLVSSNDRQRSRALVAAFGPQRDAATIASACIESGETATFELEYGGAIWQCRVSRVPADAGQSSALLVARDVSRERENERRLLEQERHLQQAKKLETASRIAAGVAHDMDNLMFAIEGSLETAEALMPPKGRHVEACAHLRLGIQQARAIAARLKTATEPPSLDLVPTDVDTLVRAQLALLRNSMPDGIELGFESAFGRREAMVLGSAADLAQAITNLVVNARDATPEGSIRLALTPYDGDGTDRLALTIADDGAGMTDEVLDRAFEPYFTTKVRGQGTGLGLAIVRTIVTSHGGEIAARSEPGVGTEFRILLPRYRAPGRATRTQTTENESP
ncbi:MAG: ATP-binding protein [Planctomycetota bacterium]